MDSLSIRPEQLLQTAGEHIGPDEASVCVGITREGQLFCWHVNRGDSLPEASKQLPSLLLSRCQSHRQVLSGLFGRKCSSIEITPNTDLTVPCAISAASEMASAPVHRVQQAEAALFQRVRESEGKVDAQGLKAELNEMNDAVKALVSQPSTTPREQLFQCLHYQENLLQQMSEYPNGKNIVPLLTDSSAATVKGFTANAGCPAFHFEELVQQSGYGDRNTCLALCEQLSNAQLNDPMLINKIKLYQAMIERRRGGKWPEKGMMAVLLKKDVLAAGQVSAYETKKVELHRFFTELDFKITPADYDHLIDQSASSKVEPGAVSMITSIPEKTLTQEFAQCRDLPDFETKYLHLPKPPNKKQRKKQRKQEQRQQASVESASLPDMSELKLSRAPAPEPKLASTVERRGAVSLCLDENSSEDPRGTLTREAEELIVRTCLAPSREKVLRHSEVLIELVNDYSREKKAVARHFGDQLLVAQGLSEHSGWKVPRLVGLFNADRLDADTCTLLIGILNAEGFQLETWKMVVGSLSDILKQEAIELRQAAQTEKKPASQKKRKGKKRR